MGEYSMQEAMKQFLNKSRIKGSVQALQIEDIWEQLMGKTIARYTEKISRRCWYDALELCLAYQQVYCQASQTR